MLCTELQAKRPPSLAWSARRLAWPLVGSLCVAFAACAPLPPAPLSPPPAAPPEPQTVYVPTREPVDLAARHLLAYQAVLLAMSPAELAREVSRLGDGSASVADTMDLALALGLTRSNGDLARAQGLLDQVLANGNAQAWHGLARLLATRYGEQRRADEQTERANQQLREAQREHQRKLDQLNDKLEALKSIERSLNSRPVPVPVPVPQASAAKPAQRP